MMCESDPTSIGVWIKHNTIRINKMMELLIAVKRIATKRNMMMIYIIIFSKSSNYLHDSNQSKIFTMLDNDVSRVYAKILPLSLNRPW